MYNTAINKTIFLDVKNRLAPLSESQKEEIVQYMADHTNFARNRITDMGWQGSDKAKVMWKKLSKIINDCPGPKFKARDLPQVI